MKNGRPQVHLDAAAKQRAYRERQKRESELALALLADAERKKVTLRNTADYLIAKGNRVEVECDSSDYCRVCKLLASGSFHANIEPLLFKHLVRTGDLTFDRKILMAEIYRVTWKD